MMGPPPLSNTQQMTRASDFARSRKSDEPRSPKTANSPRGHGASENPVHPQNRASPVGTAK
jgi:hypothetical protein